jgi:hypothetical protein
MRAIIIAVGLITITTGARAKEGSPQVWPTLGFAAAADVTQERATFFHSWLGASFVPVPSNVSVFVALGAEIEVEDRASHREIPPGASDREVTVIPTLRLGLAVSEHPRDYPLLLQMYTFFGWRRSGFDGDGARIGVGMTLPFLGLLMLPNMIEVGSDFVSAGPTAMVRFGWSI